MSDSLVKNKPSVVFATAWKTIVEYMQKGIRLSDEETSWLAGNRVARYIAAIPYAAKCTNPDRMAVMLLSLYVIEIRGGSPFDTRNSDMDGSLARIEPFFEPLYRAGGKKSVIDRGKTILGMKTFSHWIEDSEAHPSDRDFVSLRYVLKSRVEGLPANELLDSILNVDDGLANAWYKA